MTLLVVAPFEPLSQYSPSETALGPVDSLYSRPLSSHVRPVTTGAAEFA
jgi:hypothetical protein